MVVIRLAPGGKKHTPIYRIHVADQDAPLRGRFLEKLGTYKPGTATGFFTIDEERYSYWVSKGAVVSERVKKLLKDKKKAPAAAPKAEKTEKPAKTEKAKA